MKETINAQQELINKIQIEGCDRSMRELMSQYNPLFISISNNLKNKFINTPLEYEDIDIVIKGEFIKLVKKYDITKGTPFPAYISRYLQFGALTYIRKYTTKNHQVLNYCDSMIEDVIQKDINGEDFDKQVQFLFENSNLSELESYILKENLLGKRPMIDIARDLNLKPRNARYIKDLAVKKITKCAKSKL